MDLRESVREAVRMLDEARATTSFSRGDELHEAVQRFRQELDIRALLAALDELDALKVENARLVEASNAEFSGHMRAANRLKAGRDTIAALRTDLAALRGRAERLHEAVRGWDEDGGCRCCGTAGWMSESAAERHAPDCPAAPDFLSGNDEGGK